MNSAEQGRRPSSSLPQNQELAPAGGPSLSSKDTSVASRLRSALENASDPKYGQVDMAVRPGGGTLPGVGQGGRGRGRSGETRSAEEGGRPPTSSRRDFLIAMGLVAAATAATGGVEAKTGFLRKLFGGGKKDAKVVAPPATPDVPKNTATATSTEAPATATSTTTLTETATPAVRGPEYGHASVEQMDGVPKEVQAKIKEILKNSNIDTIGNRFITAHRKGYEDRQQCQDLATGAMKLCTSLEDIRYDLAKYPTARESADSVVPATLNLIVTTEKTAKPIVRAYDGNLEDETGEKAIKNIEISNPNKTIILADFLTEPEDIMVRVAQTTGVSYKVHKLGDWSIITDSTYTGDLLGNKQDGTQYRMLADLIAGSLSLQASSGFKNSIQEHGSPYPLSSGEGQYVGTKLNPSIMPSFKPDGKDDSSIFLTRGKYFQKTVNGGDFIRDNN